MEQAHPDSDARDHELAGAHHLAERYAAASRPAAGCRCGARVGYDLFDRIEVVARISADETVRIDFGDNGAAIPAEVSDNIFTPFFTTKPDGSGIGLSVSRRIMQLHGGSLRLTSNVDGKVTFTLFFA